MRCRRSALLVLAVVSVMSATAVVAQTEDNAATVMPADVADSGADTGTDAPAATDATPATVMPAEGSDDGSSVASSSGDPFTLTPSTPTEAPATTSPATTSPSTTAPAATTAVPIITGATAETAAPTTAAPVATQAPTAAPAATTAAPVATQAPTAAPVSTTATPVTDASAATAAPASTTAAPASTSAAPTAAPAATEAPTTAPVATQAPTAAPAATTAAPATTSAAPVATQAPTAAPVTEAPTTAPAATTTAPPATTTPAATPTATTEAPAATTPTATTAETTTSSPATSEPDASSSSSLSSASGSMANPAASSASLSSSSTSSPGTSTSGDSGADTSTSDSLGNSGGLTLSPITSDESDTDADTDTTDSSSGSEPTNASTSSGKSNSFGGWKLALVIVGALCAVMASIFFVHMRHVRAAAANKRSRGSSQQRALDSFFRQNRVTVARETGVSSGNFVDPLTPRDEIAVTIPSNKAQDRPRTDTADIIAGSAAQAFNRRTTRTGSVVGSSASIETPTNSYHSNEYDSFTGRHHAPSTASTNSSNFYRSNSLYSDSSSLGSIAPSAVSSQRSAQIPTFPSRLETVASPQGRVSKRASSSTSIGDVRDTNRSDRSSSDFSVFNASSVASSEDIYRMSTQLIDVAALPESSELRGSHDSYLSRDSDELSEFSVDESYSNESFGTVDSYASRSTSSDSIVFRTSKESELSEGEI